jgi:hypothetical protein
VGKPPKIRQSTEDFGRNGENLMIIKLTITSRFLPNAASNLLWAVCVVVFFAAGCVSRRDHITSEQRINKAAAQFSNDSDYTCRPTDPKRSNDYIWIYSEPENTTKNLRVASFAPLGKSGYKHQELILLSGVEVSQSADNTEIKTGPNTSGSFDTEYDFSKQNTLLSIDNATMSGRLQVKGYSGNLNVNCTKKP